MIERRLRDRTRRPAVRRAAALAHPRGDPVSRHDHHRPACTSASQAADLRAARGRTRHPSPGRADPRLGPRRLRRSPRERGRSTTATSRTSRARTSSATAAGWCSATRAARACVAMQGRVHMYEGHSAATVAFPARVLVALGAKVIIVTNAAGGLNPSWTPGTLMLIRDHIDMLRDHALRGPNDDRLGPRFPDMTRAYAPELRALVKQVAADAASRSRRASTSRCRARRYETPAEVQHAADARRRRDRHVDRARGRRRPPHGRARDRHLVHHEPGRRHHRRSALSHDEVTETATRVRADVRDAARRHPRGARSRTGSWEPRMTRKRDELIARATAPRHAGLRAVLEVPGRRGCCMSGEMFEGANVENASYGLRVCAERNAVAAVVVDGGARTSRPSPSCTESSPPSSPCGCAARSCSSSPRPGPGPHRRGQPGRRAAPVDPRAS